MIALLPFATAGAEAAGSPSGPLVAIPHCTTVSEGCGMDPESPDLSPAGCASTLAKQLERRGVRAEVIGPGAVVCGEGSNALILEARLTAHCPARAHDELLLDQVLSVRLEIELELKDCFSGEVLGRGRSKRSIEAGRHTLVRDAVEELSHHTAEMKIRRIFPDTPIRWMKAYVGGERSIEVSAGAVDVGGSGINELLDSLDLDQENWARRLLIELAYNPVADHRTRVGIGVELMRIKADGKSMIDPGDLNLDPSRYPPSRDPNHPYYLDPNADTPVEVDLGVLGLRGSLAYGIDFTKNQRISAQGAIGYYVLGYGLAPATVQIDGLPADLFNLRRASPMLEALARYEWRLTPHLAVSASYGYSYLEYSNPNRVGRSRRFPYDLDFTGQSIRLGIAGRF